MTLQVQVGTQVRFLVAGSFLPVDPATDFTIGTPTDVLLTLASVANDAGRQSSKADLGANRHLEYQCLATIDFTGETPVTGEGIEFYWAPSTSATAANGNVAGNSGVDGAAPAGALGSITLDEFIRQCEFIGRLEIHNGAVVQNGFVGLFSPSGRYGQMVVVNRSGDLLEGDNVEMAVYLTPLQLADA